jgi:hypothetical protein
MSVKIHTLEGSVRKIHHNKQNLVKNESFIIATILDPTGAEINVRGLTKDRPTIGDYLIGNFTETIHPDYGLQFMAKGQIAVELPKTPATIMKRCRDIAKQNDITISSTISKIISEYAELNTKSFWSSFQEHSLSKKATPLSIARLTHIQQAIKSYTETHIFSPNMIEIDRYFMELGLTWNSASIKKMLGYDYKENPDYVVTVLKENPLCIIDYLNIDTSRIQEYFTALHNMELIDDNTMTIGKLLILCSKAEHQRDSCIPSTPHYSLIISTYDSDNKYLTEYNNCIYRTSVFEKEQAIANFFVEQANTKTPHILFADIDADDRDEEIKYYRESVSKDLSEIKIGDISPSVEQQKAVLHMLTHHISTVQGSAGTGKTTTLELLRDYLLNKRTDIVDNILFLAPTGKAVDRISDSLKEDCPFVTRQHVMTIHRYYFMVKELLGLRKKNLADEEIEGRMALPLYITNPVLIVVDESSMISTEVMVMLVKAITDAYSMFPHIVFMGDGNQLAPVSYGEPYMNLIQSKIAEDTTLSQVHRQGVGSPLVTAITDIRKSKMPTVSIPGVFQICLVKQRENLKPSVLRWLEAHSADTSTMIIVPTGKKGLVGYLTPIVREYLNPSTPESDIIINNVLLDTFRIGDRMMQISNNKARNIYNGTLGTIARCEISRSDDDHTEECNLIVSVNKKGSIEYTIPDIESEMDFAYVITTHKAQGSEYDHILIIMDKNIPGFINRNLIYTAVSRGKKSVKILVTDPAIIDAWRVEPPKRLSKLVQLIAETKADYDSID